jgi:hypothetical protein
MTGEGVIVAARSSILGVAAMVAAIMLLILASSASADDAKNAAQLSDQAFALLGTIGGTSEASKAMLGPMAGFAGDAQSLSGALSGGNRAAASQAIAELQADRDAVDAAVKAHPGVIDAAKWASLKIQLDTLAKAIPPSAPGAASAVAESTGEAGGESGAAGLKVKIESLGVDADQITHVKGFLEGHNLKSAGVYSGEREIRAFDLGPPTSSLRINFDIKLAELEPGTVVRVYDKSGHSAQAQITPSAAGSSLGGVASVEPSESGVIVERGTEGAEPAEEPSAAGGAETAEIPSTAPSSPSKRHIQSHLGGLSDVQIQIENTVLVDPTLREYQIVGRIAGNRVDRATIFVDGNLAQEISLAAPDSLGRRAFNQTFVMNGLQATIRVYAGGDQYVENSIRMPAPIAPGPIVIPGYGPNPYVYRPGPYGPPPYNPYAANPYARPVYPYGTAIPGYNGYNINPNSGIAPGYNPYGYPYQPPAPPGTRWW